LQPAWIDRGLYPFESHHLDLEMGRLHYVDEGDGPPVVMVHGNPTWSFLYRDLIRRLAPGFRCVAPDHIGFGLSDKPAGWTYLPEQHAANLAALIESLDLHGITLVVQDWGGPIGLSYAVEHPDRVARVVIMNTWMWPVDDDRYYRAFSGFMGGPVGRFLIKRFNLFARSLLRRAYGDKSRLSKEVHRHYLEALPTPADRIGCTVMPREIIGSTAWLRRLWDQRAALAGKPALIAWGMKDIAFREKELNRWIEALPQAEVVRLPDVGHYVQDEAPQQLGEAVERFLTAG
jgi:haloalkane dehalogenase